MLVLDELISQSVLCAAGSKFDVVLPKTQRVVHVPQNLVIQEVALRYVGDAALSADTVGSVFSCLDQLVPDSLNFESCISSSSVLDAHVSSCTLMLGDVVSGDVKFPGCDSAEVLESGSGLHIVDDSSVLESSCTLMHASVVSGDFRWSGCDFSEVQEPCSGPRHVVSESISPELDVLVGASSRDAVQVPRIGGVVRHSALGGTQAKRHQAVCAYCESDWSADAEGVISGTESLLDFSCESIAAVSSCIAASGLGAVIPGDVPQDFSMELCPCMIANIVPKGADKVAEGVISGTGISPDFSCVSIAEISSCIAALGPCAVVPGDVPQDLNMELCPYMVANSVPKGADAVAEGVFPGTGSSLDISCESIADVSCGIAASATVPPYVGPDFCEEPDVSCCMVADDLGCISLECDDIAMQSVSALGVPLDVHATRDAASVHGVPGIVAAGVVGVHASPAVSADANTSDDGIYGVDNVGLANVSRVTRIGQTFWEMIAGPKDRDLCGQFCIDHLRELRALPIVPAFLDLIRLDVRDPREVHAGLILVRILCAVMDSDTEFQRSAAGFMAKKIHQAYVEDWSDSSLREFLQDRGIFCRGLGMLYFEVELDF